MAKKQESLDADAAPLLDQAEEASNGEAPQTESNQLDKPIKQNAGPLCPRCQVPMIARSSTATTTYYYCKKGEPGCTYSIPLARETLRDAIKRQRQRGPNVIARDYMKPRGDAER